MPTVRIAAAVLAVALSGCATVATPPPAPAVVYDLNLCGPGNTNCQVVSEHPSSGSCEAARKAYLKEHPGANVGCMKRAY